jgi:hypothetical protein
LKDLDPADLNHGICAIRLVPFAGQKSILDAMYNDTAEVGCNGYIDKLVLELSDELVAPRCTVSGRMHCRQIAVVAPRRFSRTPTGNQP